MPNNKNIEAVKKLREKVAKAKSIVLADIQGLSANNANEFRAKMLESGAEVSMAKNTLLEIALKEENIDTTEASKILRGQTIALLGYNDPIAPIKALFEFAKKFELPKVKLGFIEGKFTSHTDIETLSKLPSKEVLISQMLSVMKSPLTGIVNVFSGSQRKLVYALSAISKSKEVQ